MDFSIYFEVEDKKLKLNRQIKREIRYEEKAVVLAIKWDGRKLKKKEVRMRKQDSTAEKKGRIEASKKF